MRHTYEGPHLCRGVVRLIGPASAREWRPAAMQRQGAGASSGARVRPGPQAWRFQFARLALSVAHAGEKGALLGLCCQGAPHIQAPRSWASGTHLMVCCTFDATHTMRWLPRWGRALARSGPGARIASVDCMA